MQVVIVWKIIYRDRMCNKVLVLRMYMWLGYTCKLIRFTSILLLQPYIQGGEVCQNLEDDWPRLYNYYRLDLIIIILICLKGDRKWEPGCTVQCSTVGCDWMWNSTSWEITMYPLIINFQSLVLYTSYAKHFLSHVRPKSVHHREQLEKSLKSVV